MATRKTPLTLEALKARLESPETTLVELTKGTEAGMVFRIRAANNEIVSEWFEATANDHPNPNFILIMRCAVEPELPFGEEGEQILGLMNAHSTGELTSAILEYSGYTESTAGEESDTDDSKSAAAA